MVFFSSTSYSMSCVKDLFKEVTISLNDQIKNAIFASDVNSVLHLVKHDVDEEDLQYYIQLAQNNMGRPPKSTMPGRALGILQISLGMAVFYKTVDCFKTKYKQFSAKNEIISRYSSPHNILMDIATVTGFISSYNAVTSAMENFNPRSNYKKQLLILLYLQSLR